MKKQLHLCEKLRFVTAAFLFSLLTIIIWDDIIVLRRVSARLRSFHKNKWYENT